MIEQHPVYCVILAGGSGTRFWPRSRQKQPKQLCKIGSATHTMIELTLARLDGFVPPERRLIVTHSEQVAQTRALVGSRCAQLLAEPEAKNTAAALTLAALEIQRLAPVGSQPIMISVHADHMIEPVDAFHRDLRAACTAAQAGSLTLLGAPPLYPATGYGYLRQGRELFPRCYEVAEFKEKPPLATAQEYCERGDFFWNTGIFCWRVDIFLIEIAALLPATYKALRELLGSATSFAQVPWATICAAYRTLAQISVDEAVIEKSQRVAFIPARFAWQDVGSWDALAGLRPLDAHGNSVQGDVLLLESRKTLVDAEGLFVAAIGVDNLVIVAAPDAVLVCSQERAQEVKKIAAHLQAKGRTELL